MPTSTERQRLTLAHHPPITIAVTSDGHTATYRLHGRRLSGALEVQPYFDDDTEALPSLARIMLGITGDRWQSDQQRAELLTINGVQLTGPYLLDPIRHILNAHPRLHPSRVGAGEPTDATCRYFTEAITAVMIHYLGRPQTRTEQRNYARTTAPARLARVNTAILATARQLATARTELTRLQTAALALARLGDTS